MQSQVPGLDFSYSVSLTEQIGQSEQTVMVMLGSKVGGESFAAIKLFSTQEPPGVPHLPRVSEAVAVFSERQNPETFHALHELAQAIKREGGEEWIKPKVEYGDDPTASTPGYDSLASSPNGYC